MAISSKLRQTHFHYKEVFAASAQCDELRNLILAPDVTTFATTLIAHDPILKGRWPRDEIDVYRLMCSFRKRTTLIISPFSNGIAFYVGVLGTYVGAISVPADMTNIKKDGGAVYELEPGGFQRRDFKEFVLEFQQYWEQYTAKMASASNSPPDDSNEPTT